MFITRCGRRILSKLKYCTKSFDSELKYLNSLKSYSKLTNFTRYYCVKSEISHDSLTYESNSSKLFDEINYDAITGGDEETLSKLKRLILEIDLLYESGEQIPSKLKVDQWQYLLQLGSRSSRMKHLKYLFLIEKKKGKSHCTKIRKTS